MIYLKGNFKKDIIGHSMEESPNEACGIVAGRDRTVEKVYRMENTDKSAASFFMDPEEQLRTMKKIRCSGLDFLGIYHSHPETRAYPSAHDVELAYYQEVSYIIVSLKDKDNPDIRSYKIVDGKITEEEVKTE